MSETPLYEELEAQWSDEYYHRAICDQYWTVTHTATGQEWFEDDEGNEVFPGMSPTLEELNEGVDLTAYLVPNEVRVGDTVIPIKLGEPQYAEGQYTMGTEGEALASQRKRESLMEAGYKALASDPEYIREATVRKEGRKPKPKFKLFGRNQGTNGTL